MKCVSVTFWVFIVGAVSAQTNVNLEDFQGKTDICFVIDDSGSIKQSNKQGQDNWRDLKDFVKTMVQNLPIDEATGAKVSIVRFSSNVEEIHHLNKFNTQEDVMEAIDNLGYTGGNTNTATALKTLRTEVFSSANGDRKDARNIAVLITDGIANVNVNQTLPEARLVRQDNIQLFTVGVTDYVNKEELKDISSDPVWYHYFLSPDFSHLNVLKDKLVTRVKEPDLPPLARCDARADVIFVLDNSGSIRQKNPKDESYDNWDLLKRFVNHVIDSLDTGPDKTRVGVIKYSETAELVFHLNTYLDGNKTAMKEHVRGEEYMSGGTNTSGAIRVLRTEMFKEGTGDRANVRNVAIVITDGESTIAENKTIYEAKLAKLSGIKLFAIGLTDLMDEKELKAIASPPINDHYLNSTDIPTANTLVSRLVVNLCANKCPLKPTGESETVSLRLNDGRNNTATVGEGIENTACVAAGITRDDVCPTNQTVSWIKFEKRIIVGNNYLRLPYIQSDTECKKICLQQKDCKSVEYTSVKSECAVSHVNRKSAGENFVTDPDTNYYEVSCLGGSSDSAPSSTIVYKAVTEPSSNNKPSSTTRPSYTKHLVITEKPKANNAVPLLNTSIIIYIFIQLALRI